MTRDRLAVLMTCYNRKPKTLACLAALYNQRLPSQWTMDVYLVDDSSTDGTAEAVRQMYPQVKILHGDGTLFWNGGMRLAWAEAMKQDYDYYLWLNDDTVLYPEAINTLLVNSHQLSKQGETHAIIVGSTQDPETGNLTYGGVIQRNWWHPFHFRKVPPTETVQRCDSMNGNCVLIPQCVVQLVGNLDPVLRHYAADYDYGLRAKSKGCTVWIAPDYVGICPRNSLSSGGSNSDHSLSQSLGKMNQPKGVRLEGATLISPREWKVFTQRHGGLLWLIYWLLPYRRVIGKLVLSKHQSSKP
ncbi:glycosyl transferase, group 2 family protein [Coleofasciculus chthonoplastes PCC 7420]|uniref:Glycosyl transferase, group 2 family protein n=1 Tax=Coleofasciculus chthonoplastes PCC 7420 TaxID=118168 RepID=B4VTG9_9CYAN|nr:glycosyltransferase family 2 protein [Coleofasciculus chthonoplastes]EDX74678.1 glycosyl transferase, group 2 family protein [Coleofasciculus chthonoplastes PCC 7420]